MKTVLGGRISHTKRGIEMWVVYDKDGKLAITLGWLTDYHSPTETKAAIVSNINAGRWKDLIGRTVKFKGNVGLVWIDGRPWRIDTSDTKTWTHLTETRPIRKPRKGKRQGMKYDWEWRRGRWQRFWL